ncbi:MAG: SPFH domain-containing protein [Candidatus Izemoplasmatales bacterium]|jgi:flotillin|nr:SPFH domain-containing protein [bacterium]MDZ4197226.1 SPFH domain-containing protein [Candidatus Izemoplasmatales bacterium]
MPEFLQVFFTILIVVLVIGTFLFLVSYVKVKPDRAYIITGPRKSRVVTGKATLRIPFLERIDIVPLDLIQVDIKTVSAVPTNEFINIFVDGVANIKIKSEPTSIKLAGEIFLSRKLDDVKQIAREVLEGNMREIIGQMKLKELVQNRDKFAEQVRNSAMQDMQKMGLEIINITIQNFSDKNGVIEDLGVDNVTQIRKDASIARANSEKEVQIATAQAKELANASRIEAELKIEVQNTELALKKASLKEKADIANAQADVAYSIRLAEENKRVNIAQQDAEIAKRDKEIELRTKEVQVEERTLEAKIKKVADAEKYALQQRAEADLFVRTKEADAKLAEEQRRAESIKVAADADRFAQEQRAIGIQKVGFAEAEAIEKKAEAMKRMGEASVLELILNSNVLPNIVQAAAAPLAQTEKIVMYGDGNSTKLISDVMMTSSKVLEAVKESTGLDLGSLLAGFTGSQLMKKEAKEDK